MSANADTFQWWLLVREDPMAAFKNDTVSGHQIETLECIKILGITFGNQLKFGAH